MFIEVKTKDHVIAHGFDEQNRAIEEQVTMAQWTTKIIAVERIKSVTEKYILTDYAQGRWIYWEYEGGLEKLRPLLAKIKNL